MQLVIVGHPAARMRQRGITPGDIEHALRSHVSSWSTPKNSVQYVGPGLNGRELKVWLLPPGYLGEDSVVTVKSAAWKGEEDPS